MTFFDEPAIENISYHNQKLCSYVFLLIRVKFLFPKLKMLAGNLYFFNQQNYRVNFVANLYNRVSIYVLSLIVFEYNKCICEKILIIKFK
jgi:hypothetical protein